MIEIFLTVLFRSGALFCVSFIRSSLLFRCNEFNFIDVASISMWGVFYGWSWSSTNAYKVACLFDCSSGTWENAKRRRIMIFFIHFTCSWCLHVRKNSSSVCFSSSAKYFLLSFLLASPWGINCRTRQTISSFSSELLAALSLFNGNFLISRFRLAKSRHQRNCLFQDIPSWNFEHFAELFIQSRCRNYLIDLLRFAVLADFNVTDFSR